MIIMDEKTDRAFVLMNLDDYEAELDVSHDMGVMDAVSSEEEEKASKTPDIWDVMPEAGDEAETWDPEHLSEDEAKDLEQQYEVFAAKSASEAKVESATKDDLPNPNPDAQKSEQKEEDFGEEEFYLEPVD